MEPTASKSNGSSNGGKDKEELDVDRVLRDLGEILRLGLPENMGFLLLVTDSAKGTMGAATDVARQQMVDMLYEWIERTGLGVLYSYRIVIRRAIEILQEKLSGKAIQTAFTPALAFAMGVQLGITFGRPDELEELEPEEYARLSIKAMETTLTLEPSIRAQLEAEEKAKRETP
jgi:hypothetical protein